MSRHRLHRRAATSGDRVVVVGNLLGLRGFVVRGVVHEDGEVHRALTELDMHQCLNEPRAVNLPGLDGVLVGVGGLGLLGC